MILIALCLKPLSKAWLTDEAAGEGNNLDIKPCSLLLPVFSVLPGLFSHLLCSRRLYLPLSSCPLLSCTVLRLFSHLFCPIYLSSCSPALSALPVCFFFCCSPLLSLSYNVVCLVLFIPVPFILSSLSVLLRTSLLT